MDEPDYYVDIQVEFPKEYPKVLPKIEVVNVQPNDSDIRAQIEHICENYPKQYLGSGSIHEVTGAISDLLPRIASFKATKRTEFSLEEERAAKESATQRKAAEEEAVARKLEAEEASKQEQLLAAQIEKERQRRKDAYKKMEYHREEVDPYDFSPEPIFFEQRMTFRDKLTQKDVNFKAVEGREVTMNRKDKKITIVTPWGVDPRKHRLPPLLLKEIYLLENAETKSFLKQTINGIEELLQSSKEHSHPNVVQVLGYKVERELISDDDYRWKISILTEYASKGPLLQFLLVGGPISQDKIQEWSLQVLDALDFFDKEGYIHPAVHNNNILLFPTDEGGATVKLSDGYGTALRDLVLKARDPEASMHSETPLWIAPELNQSNAHRTAQTCIWDLGVVMLHMSWGKHLLDKFTSPQNCIDNSNFSDSYVALLKMMFQVNPQRRPTAHKLQSARFYHEKVSSDLPMTRPKFGTLSPWSRYETDYDEIERLGKGGFGFVTKARNRTDNQVYAVKVIRNDSSEQLSSILDEVTLFCKLNHSSIVRYFTTWYEPDQSENTPADESSTQEGFTTTEDDLLYSLPATGHDFMAPSSHRMVGPEYDSNPFGTNSSQGSDEETSSSGSDDDDGNMFAYQKPPKADDSVPEVSEQDLDGTEDSLIGVPPARRPSSIQERQQEIQKRPEKSTLYIVMELCSKRTLRVLINNGLTADVETIWRMLRQITDGLAYIHKQGVVHRDLKPENVFLDEDDNPKIGDFGLATKGQVAKRTRIQPNILFATEESVDIGTRFYTAPELRSGGSRAYSSKVDMYSLGIMFYEMNYRFSSQMQRYEELGALGEAVHSLPGYFDQEQYRAQGRIILKLVDHNQDNRPTAQELLESRDVPAPLEEEKFRLYVQRMAGAEPGEYRFLLSKFLERTNDTVQDLAWDEKDKPYAHQMGSALSMSINQQIESIFRRHGAVVSNRESLFPKASFYSNAATILDASGLVLQLPHDLTLPFARSIAQKAPAHTKYFCFGNVYRAASNPGGEPTHVPEIDFDYVSFDARDLAVKEGEVIKVLDEILYEIPALRSKSWVIILNHADLLDLILKSCHVKKSDYSKVKRALSQLNVGRTNWAQVRSILRSTTHNIADTSVDGLARFNFSDEDQDIDEKIIANLDDEKSKAMAQSILARLNEVVRYLNLFGVKTKFRLAPLSNNSEQLYRGSLMFHCIEKSSRQMIAVGGRYDSLITDYNPKPGSNSTRAVGFRLNVLDIISYVRNDLRKASSNKLSKNQGRQRPVVMQPTRCDVLVTSFDAQTLVTSCIECVQSLWAAGISAEVTEHCKSLEELDHVYQGQGSFWIVIIKSGSGYLTDRIVKLRSPTKEESELNRTELVSFLKTELTDRPQFHMDNQGGKLKRLTSSGQAGTALPDRSTQNIDVLTPQHRNKKVNRAAIVDAACVAAKGFAENLVVEAPIVAIDTSNAVLEQMRNTRIFDDGSWRALRGLVQPNERKYLEEVQELLQEKLREDKSGAFVFNYKTKSCIYYDFGKSL